MNNSALHSLNTIPAAEAVALAASTPAHVTAAFGPHARLYPDPGLDTADLLRPFHISDMPGRLDGGVDTRWGEPLHRAAVRCRRFVGALRDRLSRRPRPLYARRPANGAFRGLLFGLLLEALGVGGIVAFVLLRKVY